MESPIIGRESEVARLLGVSSDIVRERIRVLTRRDTIGRTGVFLKLVVPERASFEEVLKSEAESNPALRRTLRERQRWLKKVDNVVIILHVIHHDFCLETDRESFGVGEHSTIRSSLEKHTQGSGVLVDHADREGHEII
jgi:hypothetical protein